MRAPHIFLMWYVLREMRPDLVVESGIWKGQGTWFIEKACPSARIICMDPDLSRLEYKSPKALYTTEDFSSFDFSQVDAGRSVVFFDDHQHAPDRLFQAASKGFSELLFEDNYYPAEVADCYTLKVALAGESWYPEFSLSNILKRILHGKPKPYLHTQAMAQKLERLIDVYEELPPVALSSTTRWNTEWSATPSPLLTGFDTARQEFWDEADAYTWMAYVRLRQEAGAVDERPQLDDGKAVR